MSSLPGARANPWIQTLRYLLDPVGYVEKLHAEHGDVFRLDTVVFGPEVVVVRPEAIRTVFTGDPETLRAGEANITLEPVLGNKSVLLLDGAEHLRHRRLLLPPFHGERMLAYAKTMREVTERVVADFPDKQPFALHPFFQRITLEIILRTVFGVERGEELDALANAITRLLDRVANPLSMVATLPQFRRSAFGLSPWDLFRRLRKRVDDQIYDLIARRRRERATRDDVLSMLLAARDEAGNAMTDEELRDELMTLLVAGHETTATQMCWAFDEILRDARVLSKLGAEVDAAADLAHVPYLEATIKEALRLHPVIPAVGRRTTEPMTIDGRTIPAGTLVVPGVWLTHHLPDVYPRPFAFEPERFLDKKVDPYAWLPFGGGVRRCIGMAFALSEMKIVIGTILQRVRLRAASPRPARTVLRAFTHSPRGGVKVVLEERRPPVKARGPAARAPRTAATTGA
jgi:cytochrome P450